MKHRLLAWLLSGLLPALVASAIPTPELTATKDDGVAAGARMREGDTITYTVTVANTGGLDALDVTLADPTPLGTTLVAGSLRVTPVAMDDVYVAVGNTQRIVPASEGVLVNDVDPDDPGAAAAGRLQVKSGSVARVGGTAAGGSLVIEPDGSFTYTPGVGQVGTERFSYVVTDAHGQDSLEPAVIEFNLGHRVWYVRAGASGDGRSHAPLGSPATASASATAATDIIYVLASASPLNGGFVLDDGQQLLGQGVDLIVDSLPLALASTAPVVTNTGGTIVTVAKNNTIRGLTLHDASAYAIAGTDVASLTVTEVAKTGSGRGVSLTGGVLNVAFSAFTTSASSGSGAHIHLSGCTGTFTAGPGVITNTTANRSIDIQGGDIAVSLQADISDSGSGILIQGAGSTSFTGPLTLNTGSSSAFSIIDTASVSATHPASTVATTTGTAVNITRTTIAAAGVKFRSINSTTASDASAIILNATGATDGGFEVTGTGVALSGGTISRKSGDAIYLNDTRNVVLTDLRITESGGSHIDATHVVGLTLTRVSTDLSTDHGILGNVIADLVVTGGTFDRGGAGNSNANYDGFHLRNLLGTSSITGATFKRSNTRQVFVVNTTANNFGGAPDTLTVSGTTWTDHSGVFSGDHLSVSADSGANFQLTVDDSAGTNSFTTGGSGIQATATGADSWLDVAISGVSMSDTASGVVLAQTAGGAGALTYSISNNQGGSLGFSDTGSLAIAVTQIGTASCIGTIANNAIAHSAGPLVNAVQVVVEGEGTGTARITNNTINGDYQRGIHAQARSGTGSLNLTIDQNSLLGTDTSGNALQVVHVESGGSGTGHANVVQLDLRNNAVTLAGGAQYLADYRLVNRASCTFALYNFTGNGSQTSDVEAWIKTTRNNLGGVVGVVATSPFSTVGTVPAPLLLAAGGSGRTLAPSSSSIAPAPAVATRSTIGSIDAVLSEPDIARPEAEVAPLTQADLERLVAAARGRWEAAGLTPEQAATLHALRFELADLDGLHLGEAAADRIRLDTTAGGSGWYLDSTPHHDEEFFGATTNGDAAAGQIDLLTAILHEMGHALGLEDRYGPADRGHIMYGFLKAGERRLPSMGEAGGDAASSSGRERLSYLSAPVTIGTLPAGRSVRIAYSVTVTAAMTIQSQGTVTADGGVTVLTDDPNIAGDENPTVTEVEQPATLGDVTKNGDEDSVLALGASDFDARFSDGNGDLLVSVTILTAPSSGRLQLDGEDLAVPATLARNEFGGLTHVPAENFFGDVSFTWTAADAVLAAVNTASVNLTYAPVADAPSVSTGTTLEDTLSTPLVLTRNVVDGAEVTHVRVDAITNGQLYLADGLTEIEAGDIITIAQAEAGLMFMPGPDLNTDAGDTFSFEVRTALDASGTGLSAPTTVTITVSEGNDVPTAVNDVLSGFEEDSGPWTIPFADLIANDVTGPANESAQTLTITAVSNPIGGLVAIDGTDVIFTPNENFHGAAGFTYEVTDDGTTGGKPDPQATSAIVSFTVSARNDAPTISAPAAIAGGPTGPFAVGGIAFSDPDGDFVVQTVFTVSTGSLAATSDGGVVVGGTSSSLTLTGLISDLNAFLDAGRVQLSMTENGTLHVLIDDLGNVGAGGAATAEVTVDVEINQRPVAGLGQALFLEADRSEGVTVPDHASLAWGAGSFTIEAWFRRTDPSATGLFTIAAKQLPAGGNGWFLRLDDHVLSFFAGSNGVTTTAEINDDNWHHVAAVFDAEARTTAIYLDGALSESKSFAAADDVDTAAPLGIGYKPGYGEHFDGALDEVRLWSVARKPAQIEEYRQTPLRGDETALIAYWNFDDAPDASVDDRSLGENVGTLLNAGGAAEWVDGGIALTAYTDEDTAITLRLGGSDRDDQAAASAIITALPLNGTLYQTDDGSTRRAEILAAHQALTDAGGNPRRVIYAPELNHTGADSFSYQVHDGVLGSTNTVVVTLDVGAINDAPTLTAVAALTGAREDEAFSISYTELAAAADEADVDGDPIQFRIVEVSSGSLTKDGTPVVPGITLLGSGESLSWTPPSDASGTLSAFMIEAFDGVLASGSAVVVSVVVAAVNDAPVFVEAGPFTVAETATAGTVIGQIDAHDGDGGPIDGVVYSIVGGTAETYFAIDASGSLTVTTAGANALDHEVAASLTLIVRADDGAEEHGTTDQVVTISVTDVAPTLPANQSFTIAENLAAGSAVGTIMAAGDTDSLNWSLLSGNVDGAFSIDPSTGELTVANSAAVDFEQRTQFTLGVRVTDGTTAATGTVQIQVTDVNEAPVFTSAAAISVGENQTSALTLTASDPEGVGSLTFAIAGGADATRFSLVTASGVLTFVSAPDFEAPADADADNTYELLVTVSDGVMTSSAHAVAISVTNVNETPTVTSASTASVAENLTTAYTATGSDPDAGDVLSYALAGGDDVDLFTIDAQTGVVSFKTPPNFERPGDADGNNTYTFAVTATDGALTSAPHAVTVTVTDVAEAPILSDAHVTVTGATGTGGAFRIGDTVTVTWDNTTNGDANEDQVTDVTVDFTAFGGGVVAATDVDGIWTARFALVPGSVDTSGCQVVVTADNAGLSTTLTDSTSATVDTIAPIVSDVAITLGGSTGLGGAFRIGDTVTAAWDNRGSGDSNPDVDAVIMDFTEFEGEPAVDAQNESGLWSATWTLVAGARDRTGANVVITVVDDAGNETSRIGTTDAIVDTIAPVVTGTHISVSGATGPAGTYRIGDVVTVVWDNSSAGDNHDDDLSDVSVDLSGFGAGSALTASEVDGFWTATAVITAGTIEATGVAAVITVTDDAGNALVLADDTNATVDNRPPAVVSVTRSVPSQASIGVNAVTFRVTFDEAIVGLDATDLSVSTTGITTALLGQISPVAGSDRSFDIDVHSIAGAGTLALDVLATADVRDVVGNRIQDGYAAGEAYTILPAPVIERVQVIGRVGEPFSYVVPITNQPTDFSATGLPAGLTVGSTPGTIVGTPTGAGEFVVTLKASNAGGSGTEQLELTIEPGLALVELGRLETRYTGAAQAVTTTTRPAGLAVVVTYDGAAVAPTDAGTYVVAARVVDPNYSGSATASFVIHKAEQTIQFQPPEVTVGSSAQLTATASSGLPVNFAVVRGSASIDGANRITVTAAGEVVVRATQAGDENYEPVSVERTLGSIKKLTQTITFDALDNRRADEPEFTLAATASSGLPVSFVLEDGPALLTGNRITLTGAPGDVIVTAVQPGNDVYEPAPSVTRRFTVVAVGPYVYFGWLGPVRIAVEIDPNRRNGTLIGVLPTTGEAFVLTFQVGPDGRWEASTSPLAPHTANVSAEALRRTGSRARASGPTVKAASSSASASLTFRGEFSGSRLVGSITELDLEFEAELEPLVGPTAEVAGYYGAPVLYTSAGWTHSIVGASGRIYVLIVGAQSVNGALGEIDANGDFVVEVGDGVQVSGRVDAPNASIAGRIILPDVGEEEFAGIRDPILRTDRLINLSARARLPGGAAPAPLITGFYIGGTTEKTVLLRGVGPTLAEFGLSDSVENPRVRVYDANRRLIAENDDWGGGTVLSDVMRRVGAFALAPAGKDAALLLTLQPGAYTVHLDGDQGGVALAEIYDASMNPQADDQHLMNVSSRGTVTGGDGVLIAGFIVTGNAPKRVLVRGVGPALRGFNLAGALADAIVSVFDRDGVLLAENDNWEEPRTVRAGQVSATGAEIAAANAATGAFEFASGSKDAAVILTVAPGNYTVHLGGIGGNTGDGLIEVYEISE